MKNNLSNILVGSFAFLGVLCISGGIAIPKMTATTETSKIVKLSVTQKKVSTCKTNEIKLNEIEIEVNNPLSVDAKDYLINPSNIDDSIIKLLKLDTSNVNNTQVGKYTYTITYDKKIYNGTVVVKSKPLPQLEILSLNTLSFEVGTVLPTDVKSYVKEALLPEVVAAIKIDTSNVDITKPGSYLYSISYNGQLYTSTITIYEPKYGKTNTETETNNNSSSEIQPQVEQSINENQ